MRKAGREVMYALRKADGMVGFALKKAGGMVGFALRKYGGERLVSPKVDKKKVGSFSKGQK